MTLAIDLFDDFATDATAEQDGIWVPYAGDVEFLIARAGNKKYSRFFLKLYEANRRLLDTKGETSEKKGEEITIKTLAKGILLDWKGALKYKGEALPYSVENAEKILAHADFRKWVVERSEDMSKFKLVQEDADSEK